MSGMNSLGPPRVPEHQRVSINRALPGDTTAVSIPMTRDGGPVVAAQSGALSGVGGNAKTQLEWDTGTWDANIVGSALFMTSGANAGLWRVVRTRTDANDIVVDPFPNDCVAAETFYVDKPKVPIHDAHLKIDTDTTGFDVHVAIGTGVVAAAANPDVTQVEPVDVIPLDSKEGFTDISIVAGGNLAAYTYNLSGM